MKTKTEAIFELSAPYDNMYQGKYTRLLFVCSAGLLRSATGATVGSQMGFNTRNCGSASYALVPLSVNLIAWAHKIYFVHEENYLVALDSFFGDSETTKWLKDKAVVLDLEDNFDYMNPELVRKFEEVLIKCDNTRFTL